MDEQERLVAEEKEKEYWEIEPVLDILQRRYYQLLTSKTWQVSPIVLDLVFIH